MKLKPISLREANRFVERYHRHHRSSHFHKFSIGLLDKADNLRGVVIIGKPVSRMLDNGYNAEVSRLCTDGYKNACSFLYSAAARAAKAMGYTCIYTYILNSESGISLKASGWECEGQVRKNGYGWNNRNNRREENQGPKIRWKKEL